jgi:hypothetical protein
MIACPNKSSQEWKNLVSKIGEFEAMREYLKLGNGDIPSLNEIEKFDKLQDKIGVPISENSLFGLDMDNPNKLEFQAITISAVTNFLEAVNVGQNFVSEFLSKDGSVIEGALAAANFLNGTVDIIDDVNKRPDAWNKLPEEAAHWWYRLLKQDDILKRTLWQSHRTALKASELYKTKYGKLEGITKSEDLTEEAIGHLIAEAIKKIEDKKGTKEDYSFINKILTFINRVLAKFKMAKQDPFEIAAMKILASDVSGLLTVKEYNNLVKNSITQIHEGEIYDGDYLNELFEENLKDKDKHKYKIKVSDVNKTVPYERFSVESVLGFIEPELKDELIKSIKTFRSKNPKLQICTDKGYGPDDIVYFTLANGKTGAFVKATNNFAFKDFHYYLDYKNKITIGRKSYYLLTDDFSKGTQREFYEQHQNELARRKAAKEGRYIIKMTKNPYLSSRIKAQFLKYIEDLKNEYSEINDIKEAIERQKTLINKYEKRTDEELKKKYDEMVQKSKEDNPEIRKEAIEILLKNINQQEQEIYKPILENLPTIVLVNMNLSYIGEKDLYGTGKENEFNMSFPFQMDPFLQEVTKEYKDYKFKIIPNTSTFIPEGYQENIDNVNRAIINNTFDNELTDTERRIVQNLGFVVVNNIKTKAMAIAINIVKTNKGGFREASKFVRDLKLKKQNVVRKLQQKLEEKFPEHNELIYNITRQLNDVYYEYTDNQNTIFNYLHAAIISNRVLLKLNTKNITDSEKLPHRFYFLLDGQKSAIFKFYNPYSNETYWKLDEGVSYDEILGVDSESFSDISTRITNEQALEYYNKYAIPYTATTDKKENIKRISKYIYDAARYSPDLIAINDIIDKLDSVNTFFESFRERDNRHLDPYSYEDKFGLVYEALILKEGKIYEKLKGAEKAILENVVGSILSWVSGAPNSTAFDILQEKLDKINEFIKAKNTIINFRSGYKETLYTPETGQITYYESSSAVKVGKLIEQQLPVDVINSHISDVLDKEDGSITLTSTSFPEGIAFYNSKIINFPNLTDFPKDFKFDHRLNEIYIPNVKLEDLSKKLHDYIITNNVTAKLQNFEKKSVKIKPNGLIDEMFVSKIKSNMLSLKEAKYSFDHNASLFMDEKSFPFYTLGIPGNKFRVEISAPENSPFPKKLYEGLRLNHGGRKMTSENPIGWFSGMLSGSKVYITEVQSDLLQRLFEISTQKMRDELNKKRKAEGKTELRFATNAQTWEELLKQFPTIKSKVDNHYAGWLYIFTGTSIKLLLKNYPNIKEIYIPTSETYKNNVSQNSPYQYYDKIASVYPSAELTEDGKYYKIKREDIFSGISKDTKGYFDVIIKSAMSAGIKEQREITPDIGSDQDIAKDILTTLFDIDILSEYLSSKEGKEHIEEIEKWITEKYSDEKPMTDDTQGGELVDSEGNVISDDEQSDEDRRINDLILQSNEINQRRAPIDVDDLLEQLQQAIQDKDVPKQNFIKNLLKRATDENDTLFGLNFENESIGVQDSNIPDINNKEKFEEHQQKQIGTNIVNEMANMLANNFNVSFEIVTADEARALTKDTEVPWNGEPAFFFNGKVYFTKEGFNMENVLHEYSHPLLDCLHAQNPVLFNKLLSDFLATPEGAQVLQEVIDEYKKDINVTDPRFAKEIMARALAKEAMNGLQNQPNTKEFKGFLDKLLFNIRQLLRKVFGTSVKVEKLSTKTTLKELADMLRSEKFNIDTELITHKDFVEYARAVKKEQESFDKIEDNDIAKTIKLFYSLIGTQISQTEQNAEKYADTIKLLVSNQTNKSLLEEIQETLENAPELQKEKPELTELEIRQANVTNFIYAMQRFELISIKVLDHLDELAKRSDSVENMNNVFYYDLLSRSWSKFMKETHTLLTKNGMSNRSAFGTIMNNIKGNLDTIDEKIKDIYSPGVIQVLFDHLEPLRKGIDIHYQEEIDSIRNSNTIGWGNKQNLIDAAQKKWDESKLTKERLADLLFGKEGDTNAVSYWIESFLNNPDPVVGGLGVFVKNQFNKVNAEFQRNSNEFIREIGPLLEAAGYSMSDFTSLMSKISFKDTMYFYNADTDKLDEKIVWTFLNEFKGVNTILKKYKYDYDQALAKGDQEECDRILKQINEHKKDYFHQQYVDSYYNRQDVYDSLEKNKDLEDAVYKILGVDKASATKTQKDEAAAMYDKAAKEAYRRKNTILNQIKTEDGANILEEDYDEVAATKKELWKQYTQMASLTNLSGDPKTGEELLTALIEAKYRKITREFYEWVPREGQFEFGLNLYEQKLITDGYTIGSPEFKEKRDKWIKDNTVIKYTQEYYDDRNEVLSDIRAIMDRIEKINPEIRKRIDSTAEMEEFLDIAMGYRDTDGQIMGNDISERGKQRVRDLQQAIIDKKDLYVGMSGLNKAEEEELGELFDKIQSKQKLTTEERLRMDDLLEKRNELGVDKATRTELAALYRKLFKIQSKEATDYYVDILNNWLGKMGVPNMVDNFTADEVLRPETYTDLLDKDPEFKKWFEKNHIKKEIFDYTIGDDGAYVTVYERLFIWNRTRPNDPKYYETTKLENGEIIQGVPSLSFFNRKVKEKYTTKKKVGKTVDNKGNFLPKTIADGAKADSPYINEDYEKLRRNNPAAFKVLEKMKEYHLKWQEDTDKDTRLYMQAPRYGITAGENFTLSNKINKARRFWLNIRNLFNRSAVNYEQLELNYRMKNQLIEVESMFDQDKIRIPITGLSNIDPDQVSMDFLDGMLKYRHGVLIQKTLLNADPFAQALKKIVNDEKNLPSETNKWSLHFLKSTAARLFPFVRSSAEESLKSSGNKIDPKNYVRAKAVNFFYEREFEGRAIIDGTDKYPWMWRIFKFTANITSKAAFATNIPSAIKNRNAAIIAAYIEGGGGRFLSVKSLALGKPRAMLMMSELGLTNSIYSYNNKSLNIQLMQIFDVGQEFLKHSIHKHFGRSIKDDFANLSFLMSTRKFLQMEATLEILCGMLNHVKIEQKTKFGKNEISYIDAWEIRNGQIELKPGIDPEYAPGGKKFNEIINQIHQVSENLEGNYAKISQPMINSYMVGRLGTYMKKFFTSMGMDHVAGTRTSASLGTVKTGSYSAFMNMITNLFKYGPQAISFMSKDQATGVKKTIFHFATVIMMNYLLRKLWGYDDDDLVATKAAVEARSGDLNSDTFNAWGWAENQALVVTLGTLTETETWSNPNLFIPQLKDQYLSWGPLYDRGIYMPWQIVKHSTGAVLGFKGSVYSKDIGPYWFQKEGSAKVWVDIANLFGLTGNTVSPVKQIESQFNVRQGKILH